MCIHLTAHAKQHTTHLTALAKPHTTHLTAHTQERTTINTPRAMVPGEASCRIVNTLFVAEKVKSEMTRERDLSQVNFINKGFESTTTLYVQ